MSRTIPRGLLSNRKTLDSVEDIAIDEKTWVAERPVKLRLAVE